jgi:hypothetical protein
VLRLPLRHLPIVRRPVLSQYGHLVIGHRR